LARTNHSKNPTASLQAGAPSINEPNHQPYTTPTWGQAEPLQRPGEPTPPDENRKDGQKAPPLKNRPGTTNEKLVQAAQEGDGAAVEQLIERYRRLVLAEVNQYFLLGAEKDDLIQEGLIGLYEAIRDFRPERGFSFTTFARLCIRCEILAAVRSATRQKHIPLNTYVSLHSPPPGHDCERTLLETIRGPATDDPEDFFINNERLASLKTRIKQTLTPLEFRVLLLRCQGKNYMEITSRLNRSLKSVDNTLYRAKRKLCRCFQKN